MRLFELAYACRVYGHLTGYDGQLVRLQRAVGRELDPGQTEHRLAMFKWLNSWGCRQFAKAHHASTASDSLTRWAEVWLARLPSIDSSLTDLSEGELDASANAYSDLSDRVASHRALSRGRSTPVSYGSTGAAKVLFALRPNAFPPWDDPIRKKLRFEEGAGGYRRYLESVAATLRQLSDEAGVPVEALPNLVRRPNSSPPKLVDEYNWVAVTKNSAPPSIEELRQWMKWAATSMT